MKPQELNLQSEVFNDSLLLLDATIQTTVATMMKKGLALGSVTMKIGFLIEEKADEKTGELHSTITIEPKISSKIGSSGSAKVPMKKAIITRNREGELIIAGNQISMDELIEKGA